MLITESLEEVRVHETMADLHLQVELGSARTRNMECNEAIFVAALDRGTHSLLADVAKQFPAAARYLLHVGHRFHERWIANRDLGDPDGTEKMGPLGRSGLLECTLGVRAENTVGGASSQQLALAAKPLAFGMNGTP